MRVASIDVFGRPGRVTTSGTQAAGLDTGSSPGTAHSRIPEMVPEMKNNQHKGAERRLLCV